MTSTAELARAVGEALALVRAAPGVREAEVFAAVNGALLARLNYTSHIPCNGVEEPKSVVNYGVGVQAVFKGADGVVRHGLGLLDAVAGDMRGVVQPREEDAVGGGVDLPLGHVLLRLQVGEPLTYGLLKLG